MKITYTQYGDYYLPDLELPAGGREIGVWGCGCPVDTSERSSEAPTEPTGETSGISGTSRNIDRDFSQVSFSPANSTTISQTSTSR